MSTPALTEYDNEHIRGLPGRLPEGETLIWQGAPDARAMAHTLHAGGLACYFLGLIAMRGVYAWDGDAVVLATTLLPLLGVAMVVVAMVVGFAWMVQRTTVYSITDRRIVFRYGVALSKAVNIPFTQIAGAGLRLNADGTGDIPLRLERGASTPYLLFWPHVRPWHLSRAEPMLRAIPDAAVVAQRLSRALVAATGGQMETVTVPARERDAMTAGTPKGAVAA